MKNEKRRIREKAESFAVCEGVVMHRSTGDKLCRVIVDPSEKERILSSLHADPVGGAHFGQTATIKKITDRFWWRSVTNDVRDFVRACALCQRANFVIYYSHFAYCIAFPYRFLFIKLIFIRIMTSACRRLVIY